MKFNKKTLTEELGKFKSDKKTFTKNAKQKIVMTEKQLDRLLNIMTEDSDWQKSLHYNKTINEQEELNEIEIGGSCNCGDGRGGVWSWDSSGYYCSCTGGYEFEGWDYEGSGRGSGRKLPKNFEDIPGHGKPGQKQMGGDESCKDMTCPEGTECQKGICVGDMGMSKTQGKMYNESRLLKTTKTINESEINKMKNMFNRLGTTGRNYNPARD